MGSQNCEYGACISLDQIKIYLQALLPAAYTVKERGKVKSPLLVFFCLFRVFLKELFTALECQPARLKVAVHLK